jgi:hypothetical protein
MPYRRLLVASLLATLLFACSAQLRAAPAPAQACDDALLTGRLVTSAHSGLAVSDPTGKVVEVVWPFGYTARRGISGVGLVDDGGGIVAQEGDFVEMDGGLDANDVWNACAGSVSVVPVQG